MKFPFYRQHDSVDCGPTCLKMVARHYGRNFALETLRKKAQLNKDGVNMLGISEAAESIGFRTRAVKLDYNSLSKQALLPAILHWNQYHFVVLYKVKRRSRFLLRSAGNDTIFVADPAQGLARYKTEEFKLHWLNNKANDVEEGVALLLEPSPDFYKQVDETEEGNTGLAFKNMVSYLLPFKKLALQLFLGMGIAALLQVFLPFLTQSVVDTGIKNANLHFVYIVLLAQLTLFTGRLVADFIKSWILLHISTRINISILTDFLIKLMKLPASFFDSKQTGDLLQRMNDHNRIEAFLTGSSINMLFSVVSLVIFSIILAWFNPGIFFVFLIASVLYAMWVVVFLKKRKTLDYKRFTVASSEQGNVIQMIQGMQEIKLNGIERSMRWRWERLQARLFTLKVKGLVLNQWQQAGGFFINEGKNIFITFLSAKAVIDGQMTLGTMLAVQYMIGQLNSPIEQMIGFMQSWQNARISMDRLNEIHKLEDEEPAHQFFIQELPPAFSRKLTGGATADPFNNTTAGLHPTLPDHRLQEKADVNEWLLSGRVTRMTKYNGINNDGNFSKGINEPAIEFRNVSFVYPGAGNEPVLQHINLRIPIGKTTAIVGVSGSGKTTLLKLLLKFVEPQKGEIMLHSPYHAGDDEGQAIRLSQISHKTWRSHCGAVMQDSFIFSDTITRNIAVGDGPVDMERLYLAAKMANILDFIESLPPGFNTKVGVEGAGLSMGQKQRLLIARAIYRDPGFIFFDEATNSLDANNESTIVNNLESFFKGRTVVIVAHRLSTVKHADQIVVLNKGAITERGTHQELVSLKGEYYTLIKNQLELDK